MRAVRSRLSWKTLFSSLSQLSFSRRRSRIRRKYGMSVNGLRQYSKQPHRCHIHLAVGCHFQVEFTSSTIDSVIISSHSLVGLPVDQLLADKISHDRTLPALTSFGIDTEICRC